MSGQQIGTVVGGVIGSFIPGVGTYLGMSIGGLIGGLVDPAHVSGPRIGDGQQQQSTDGSPIAWVQGTAMIAGTLAQYSPRRQVRHDSGGKGGPTTTTYTAVQDFAIVVCESCSIRGSTISAILVVIQDGKVVYDVRPGTAASTLAASYKWKANVDFQFGDEAQLPHPTMEAITGVGNCPSYRGVCTAIFKNFDVSTPGNRIPSFQFIVQSSGSPALSIPYTDPSWKYSFGHTTTDDFSSPTYDDSAWAIGRGGFAGADGGGPAQGSQTVSTVGPPSTPLSTMWMRRSINATPGVDVSILAYRDNTARMWWNGVKVLDDGADGSTTYANSTITIPGSSVLDVNVLAYRVCESTNPLPNYSYMSLEVTQAAVSGTAPTLDQVVSRIALRGGLLSTDIDVTALVSQAVVGYPIAKQVKATDAISPVLSAYFAYGTEYDAKLRFLFSGANAALTIARGDLLEGNGANNGDIVSNLRNQFTEFPRRVVVAYIDPAQNYYPVYVAAERRAVGVIATGDQTVQMPVVMPANDAAQAADKALKMAYALLQGTLEFSVPFGASANYLSLVAGAPVIFQSARYVLADLTLSQGYLKLRLQYDRQDAYTSVVQAIAGNAPTPSASPYSGPTTLVPMNLPSQRPQDSVGVYLAAASTTGSADWRGCVVQVSYDGQASWQNAATITLGSTLGQIDVAQPTSGEPITASILSGSLSSATAPQLAAKANAFAVTDSTGNVTQLGQFATATEVGTTLQYQLSGVSRSLGGTASTPVAVGNPFTLMDAAYFLPIDPTFAGRTLYFRAVGFGEIPESADVLSLVYTALIVVSGVLLVSEDASAPLVAEDGINQLYSE